MIYLIEINCTSGSVFLVDVIKLRLCDKRGLLKAYRVCYVITDCKIIQIKRKIGYENPIYQCCKED